MSPDPSLHAPTDLPRLAPRQEPDLGAWARDCCEFCRHAPATETPPRPGPEESDWLGAGQSNSGQRFRTSPSQGVTPTDEDSVAIRKVSSGRTRDWNPRIDSQHHWPSSELILSHTTTMDIHHRGEKRPTNAVWKRDPYRSRKQPRNKNETPQKHRRRRYQYLDDSREARDLQKNHRNDISRTSCTDADDSSHLYPNWIRGEDGPATQ